MSVEQTLFTVVVSFCVLLGMLCTGAGMSSRNYDEYGNREDSQLIFAGVLLVLCALMSTCHVVG